MADESLILQHIIRGDHAAYEYVYKAYYSKLCGFASSFFADDAHEIVQDALLKIWENRDSLGTIDNLKAYLFQSVRNACLNRVKREDVIDKYKSHAARELKQMELESMLPDADDPRKEKLSAALEQLPEQRRKIFMLSFVEGYRAQEIGEQFNISERTVHTHVYNAMKFLRNTLKDGLPVVVALWGMMHTIQKIIQSLT